MPAGYEAVLLSVLIPSLQVYYRGTGVPPGQVSYQLSRALFPKFRSDFHQSQPVGF